jgi:hypothetical protein
VLSGETTNTIIIYNNHLFIILTSLDVNRIGGVIGGGMISMLALSALDRGLDPLL